jgi:solute carrier family 12 sodium/potassium/chloride transporter 2
MHRLTQFRDKTSKEGFLDVYWLYDDGGLTLLLPYILSTRAKFSDCKLRIFFLSNNKTDLEAEAKKMATLLAKFRIEFEDVILLTDVTKRPSKQTKDDFSQIIKIRNKPVTSLSTSSLESMASDCHGGSMNNVPVFISEMEMTKNMDKTNFHLRIAEIVRENSDQSALVLMTLPLPKSNIPHSLYLAWLDFTSRNMPPFLFVRGNQESVLTFYS